jgi:MFS family permease
MNYQVMFLAAFALALISHLQLIRVKVKPAPITRYHAPTDAAPLKSPMFQKVLFIGVAIHIGFFAILPITPLHLVDTLGANEGFMALFGLAEISAAAGISLLTSRIAAKIGYQKMVGLSMVGTAIAALILATAQNLPITIIAAAFSGASWTAATIGLFGTFTDSTHDVPNADMTRYATIYHQLIFIAAFIGPLIGSNLANAGLPLTMVILLGVCLRLLAGGAILYTDHLWNRLKTHSNLRRAVFPR